MIVNEERKTTPKQRIVIALIALFLLGSTFALYAGIVLSFKNQETQDNITNEKSRRFQELYAVYQGRADAKASELSAKYFEDFSKYKSEVKAFNAANVDTLEKKDLVVGTGRQISSKTDDEGNVTEYDTDYAAYYIGWLSDEKIFDSSFDNADNPASLKYPLKGTAGMIQGWLEGIEGMKIGGVRMLTIPSVLGYGDQEQSGGAVTIPANSPLKFIVMLVEKPESIEVPEELQKLAEELGATGYLIY